jgi:hypothetical protein
VARPYVRSETDWVDRVLSTWSEQIRLRPRESVVVTPGGRAPHIIKGGPPKGTETALGRPTTRILYGQPPQGYSVPGLTGIAATADSVLQVMAGVNPRCAWVIRAEYGLVDELNAESPPAIKAAHLGTYLDARPWPSSAYADRLKRGMEMFAVGFLAAIKS